MATTAALNTLTTGNDECITVNLSEIRKEMQCPICLGIIRKTRTVMECLHRFCRECIDKSMRLGNNECPSCRVHCASRRSLRDDVNFDNLISAIYPDLDKYEEEEFKFHEEENIRNKKIQKQIADTFRRQNLALSKRKSHIKSSNHSQKSHANKIHNNNDNDDNNDNIIDNNNNNGATTNGNNEIDKGKGKEKIIREGNEEKENENENENEKKGKENKEKEEEEEEEKKEEKEEENMYAEESNGVDEIEKGKDDKDEGRESCVFINDSNSKSLNVNRKRNMVNEKNIKLNNVKKKTSSMGRKRSRKEEGEGEGEEEGEEKEKEKEKNEELEEEEEEKEEAKGKGKENEGVVKKNFIPNQDINVNLKNKRVIFENREKFYRPNLQVPELQVLKNRKEITKMDKNVYSKLQDCPRAMNLLNSFLTQGEEEKYEIHFCLMSIEEYIRNNMDDNNDSNNNDNDNNNDNNNYNNDSDNDSINESDGVINNENYNNQKSNQIYSLKRKYLSCPYSVRLKQICGFLQSRLNLNSNLNLNIFLSTTELSKVFSETEFAENLIKLPKLKTIGDIEKLNWKNEYLTLFYSVK